MPTPTAMEVVVSQISEALPWFANPTDDSQISAANAIKKMIESEHQVALAAARLVWIADGVTAVEADDLVRIAESSSDPTSIEAIFNYQWVADGIAARERASWEAVLAFAAAERRLAQVVTGFEWAADGLTQSETQALNELHLVVDEDESLALRLSGYRWMQRDVDDDETQTLYGLARIAQRSPDLANRVADAPWLKDAETVTSHQWVPIQDLHVIARANPDLARQLATLLIDSSSRFERDVLGSLAYLRREHRGAFDRLASRNWFADGLAPDEMAFIVTIQDIIVHSPEDFDEMLSSRYTESKMVDLPLSGSINIWTIQKTPFPEDEDATTQIEVALRSLEELTQTALPVKDVIVLFVVPGPGSNYVISPSNLDTPWPREAFASGHVRMTRDDQGRFNLRVLFHELGHYHFNDFPAWFLEGGANFAATYAWHRLVEGSLDEWQRDFAVAAPECSNGAVALHELGDAGFGYKALDHAECFYSMGEYFLTRLFFTLGDDATSVALSEIFTIPEEQDRPLTSKDIYLTFLDQIHPVQENDLWALFARLHGGPLFGEYDDDDDAHGDFPHAATDIGTDIVLEGFLNDPFDVDFFSVELRAGQTVLPVIAHDIRSSYVGEDLYVTLYPPDGVKPEALNSLAGAASSMQSQWAAPVDGEYYFAFESTTGALGLYSIEIQSVGETGPAIADVDEHGDNPDTASDIDPGDTLAGKMNSSSDVDYFKFQAVAGIGYEVLALNSSLEYSEIHAYGPDGVSAVENANWSTGLDRARFMWHATESGEHYLAVSSPEGNVGNYRITLSSVTPGGDDHGEDHSTATPVQIGQVVVGSLDNPADTDYFSFQTEKDQIYTILFDHQDSFYQPVAILASDGVTVLHEYQPSGGYDSSGTLIPWVAPDTDRYFVKYDSPDGDTGDYTLAIIRGGELQDDYGDTLESATELRTGEQLEGRLDQVHDFDYFRFTANRGSRYSISLDYDAESFENGEPDPRVNVYVADTLMEEYRDKRDGKRQSGRFFQWPARATGHYVVVWSPQGDIGPYTLKIEGGSGN